MFRELYLCEDRRKDPESFSMNGPKLGLPSIKISFIFVKPQESCSRDSDSYGLSKISEIRSQDHYSGNSCLLTRPK
jgi:hypothetical protein